MAKGIYAYYDTLKKEIVYIGKDSHIEENRRHKTHYQSSNYNIQKINQILQNNPSRYQYAVLYIAPTYLDNIDLNGLEIQYIEALSPLFNFTKGGDGRSGFKHSNETKRKLSEAMKGKNNPMYGKTHSKEARQKISKSHKGLVPWNKGKSHSEKTKKRISNACVGRKPWNAGKTYSEESRQKMSKAKNISGFYRVGKVKQNNCKKGFRWTYRYYQDGKYYKISSVDL